MYFNRAMIYVLCTHALLQERVRISQHLLCCKAVYSQEELLLILV